MIISLVFVFILFENVNKCVNLIRRFQKEHVTIMNKQKDIPNYEYMYETLHHALTFVELYKDRLDSM